MGCSVWFTSFTARGAFEDLHLSKQAMRMLCTPNAGGNSIVSEVLSFELLSRHLRGKLYKVSDSDSTKCDMILFSKHFLLHCHKILKSKMKLSNRFAWSLFNRSNDSIIVFSLLRNSGCVLLSSEKRHLGTGPNKSSHVISNQLSSSSLRLVIGALSMLSYDASMSKIK
ncbi:hypothetical protein FBUS_01004 [Fasciolopsis buskii]|uniref:Uncharacterized protein n=1 Tax=Fasciolopsis buskii TaxID=27845 RepID=A0A8E0VJG0_9TREM|nr:hypothetical protein FBUS_01004 [Fasciolopsis buski]